MEMAREGTQPVRARLGLWDAVSIIVGIVIGSTIFKSPQIIMSKVPSPEWGLGAWALGGVLSLIGALCYAELASTYPRSGGDYVYLSRAFGPWCGFLFGWAQLAVILTASCAMLAFVFGEYAAQIWSPPAVIGSPDLWAALLAAAAVVALSLTNILGVVLGKWTQNLLSLLKIIGLGAIVVVGFKHGRADVLAGPTTAGTMAFGTAMILVLYAYGGWNDAAFVAAEVRDRRNILRALILGTGLITIIYLAVNVAYLRVLGFETMRKPETAVAAEVGRMTLQDNGARAISVLVMVSALGAINGLIFTGSRVYSTLGAENSIFALLGRWSPRLGSPVWSILIQAAITLAMIAGVGTAFGRNGIDSVMGQLGLGAMPWDQYFGGFDTLLAGTAPVFWGFFLLSGLSLFALRQRDPDIERPFRVPLFPLLPLIFCGTCGYMLYSAIDWAKYIALIGAVPLAVGLPLYWMSRRTVADESKGA
ncbi:MAG TPA: amino acid permease [Gemmataceae bacterium]|nr:amino acid permease [Gemmataceae bacterium]